MPEPDSLQEVVCTIIHRHRQDQQILALGAQMQTEPDSKNKALTAYKHAMLPYLRVVQERESAAIAARLDHYMRSGPVFIELDGKDG